MLLRTLQVTEFQLHLKDEEMPLQRCGDVVIMEFAMGWGLNNEDLLLISRIKEKFEPIFLSDTVTAGGNHLSPFAFLQNPKVSSKSKYKSPREDPTNHD